MRTRTQQLLLGLIVAMVLAGAAVLWLLLDHLRSSDDEKFNKAFAAEVREPTADDRRMAKDLCQILEGSPDPVGDIDDIVQSTLPGLDDAGGDNLGRWLRISVQTYCPEFEDSLVTWVRTHD